MSQVDCPYCDSEQDVSNDDGFGYEEDRVYEFECRDCSKYFVFTTSFTINHDAEQAPCLNGEPHNFRQRHGAPVEYFVGRFQCSYCDLEKYEKPA